MKKKRYLDMIKKFKADNAAEIFELWKKYYNPLYRSNIIRNRVCKELEVSWTSYYEALRMNNYEEYEKAQIEIAKKQGHEF